MCSFPDLTYTRWRHEVSAKKQVDATSSHRRVFVHSKQNRMNAYLSVVGVDVANKGESNRAGGTAVLPREDRNSGKASKTSEFGAGLLPLVAMCFG